MTEALVLLDVSGGVAHITLNRPDSHNTISLELARELAAVAVRCDEDDEFRAIVLTGAGRAFCGGGDLKEFAAV